MTDYKKYINALRKCAKEHVNDRTFTGHIIVSDLCRDTANLLETLEQQPKPKTGHWIPISESFPKWGKNVLTIDNDGNYEINFIIDDECNKWFYDNDIVAWMPLPEPYKPQEES